MGFLDFFKRKKVLNENIRVTEGNHFIEYNIKVGQTLFCKNGETVTVYEIKEKTFIVDFKSKKYERDKAVLGKTLFISIPKAANVNSYFLKEEYLRQEEEQIKVQRQEEERKRQEQLEFQRKQETESKRQEQLEFQRKQEQESRKQEQLEILRRKQKEEQIRLENLEYQKKQEELRKQEELELQKRKQERERRRLEYLESQKKQEEERRKQDQARLKIVQEFIATTGGFVKDKTPIYHDIYGEGVFVDFDSKKRYIKVRFDNQDKDATFVYPDAIEKDIFLYKSKKILERENFLKNPENISADLEEQEYFNNVIKIVDKFLKISHDKENLMKYGYNDFSDSFDPHIFQKHQDSIKELTLWTDTRRNPYFARVDYGEGKKIYIGKNSIDGLVVDWRDKICNLYYQYTIYIGNDNYNLSLVRDFDIVAGIYCGFIDKYSRKGIYGKEDISNNVISDQFLLKIIKSNRGDKKTHDIIQTIQRNQYDIITYDELKNILVLGCAGSGKTMILFHRLSYIIFNHKDIDINNIYIISPTKFLNLESNDLTKTLKLRMANRLTSSSFNITIVKQYYKLNNTFNCNNFEKVNSNNLVSDECIKFIYSDNFINHFDEEIKDIVFSNKEKRQKFIESEKMIISNKYMSFCEQGNKAIDILDASIKTAALHKIYEKVNAAVSKVPLENAIEKINRINEALNSEQSENRIKTLKGKEEVLKNLIDNWNMSSRPRYKVKDKKVTDEIAVDDEIFNEVFGYFNVLGKSNKNNKKILDNYPHLKDNFINELHLFNSYKKIMERINRFNDFTLRNNKNYCSEIINSLIINIKNENKLDINLTYEFETFLHLKACYSLFDTIDDKRSYIFIDEFQDYALSELRLYKQIFSNAVINLFGDIKQSINPKGIKDSDLNAVTDENWKVFNINENYRNATQITQYVNSLFNLDMLPIGINGSVEHYDINLMEKIELHKTDRIAIIIKDLSLFEKIKTLNFISITENINVIKDEECEIKKGVLNVIPITLSKGLEFEQVYVVPEKMTENDIYVAYTRALNKLCILKVSN